MVPYRTVLLLLLLLVEENLELYLDDIDEADDVGVADGGEEADLAVEAVAEAGGEAGEPHLLHGHGRTGGA